MVYLPGVSVGPMTGVAVIPPGQRMPPPRPPLAGGVHVLTKCFFQINWPVSTSIAKMLSETPVSMAICLGPAAVVTLPTISGGNRSEEHTSELQSLRHLVCRLLLEK